MSRRGVFPFRFRGSCRLEPCLDGKVAPEIVQSAGGFDERVLKASLEVSADVVGDAEVLALSKAAFDGVAVREFLVIDHHTTSRRSPPLCIVFLCCSGVLTYLLQRENHTASDVRVNGLFSEPGQSVNSIGGCAGHDFRINSGHRTVG